MTRFFELFGHWLAFIALAALVLLAAFLTAENAKAESQICGVDAQNDLIFGNPTFQPYVDKSQNMMPAIGHSTLLIKENSYTTLAAGGGDFRIDCKPSHMSNDDPLVYPGQAGRAHHHTFFGNTSTNANSDLNSLHTTGNSTCRGGIANRSAYWVPSMIDTATSAPLVPYETLWYYKSGLVGYFDPTTAGIQPVPTGLKMLAGNPKAKSSAETMHTAFSCRPYGGALQPSQNSIPACPKDGTITASVSFPQCWDGVNLDSPDHISHMSYQLTSSFHTVNGKLRQKFTCPASHPVPIPSIGLSIKYKVTDDSGTAHWRIASDNYPRADYNAGYSYHGDFVSGWNPAIMQQIVTECLSKWVNCGNDKIGNGMQILAR